jgi:hypothetical protein
MTSYIFIKIFRSIIKPVNSQEAKPQATKNNALEEQQTTQTITTTQHNIIIIIINNNNPTKQSKRQVDISIPTF